MKVMSFSSLVVTIRPWGLFIRNFDTMPKKAELDQHGLNNVIHNASVTKQKRPSRGTVMVPFEGLLKPPF